MPPGCPPNWVLPKPPATCARWRGRGRLDWLAPGSADMPCPYTQASSSWAATKCGRSPKRPPPRPQPTRLPSSGAGLPPVRPAGPARPPRPWPPSGPIAGRCCWACRQAVAQKHKQGGGRQGSPIQRPGTKHGCASLEPPDCVKAGRCPDTGRLPAATAACPCPAPAGPRRRSSRGWLSAGRPRPPAAPAGQASAAGELQHRSWHVPVGMQPSVGWATAGGVGGGGLLKAGKQTPPPPDEAASALLSLPALVAGSSGRLRSWVLAAPPPPA